METSAIFSSLPAFHLIIVAGGSGLRAGGDVPKQYRWLGGKTVLEHAISRFAPFSLLSMAIVADERHKAYLAGRQNSFISGGAERTDSVANGLQALDQPAADDIVLVHDAARPFVTAADIASLLRAMGDAATLAAPVTDTLCREDGAYLDRTGLWAVQTPQAFRYGLLRKAHENRSSAATDDTALVAALGAEVKLVPGQRGNFKITTPDDWALAQTLLPRVPRTGTGFDVHRFDPSRPGPLRIGGIDVPHTHALLGHSDADVGLHALTDALLGAIGDGDIGQHFPPSDPRWRGADSAVFLVDAVRRVTEMDGAIANLDLTLICEAPKIGPHRAAMQARIAEICHLLPSQVGVKATTSEGLGFTGRGEGIAAQAVATVLLPSP